MADVNLPLIADYDPDRIFAWREGRPVTCARALSGIRALSARLAPDTPYINLCRDRYYFTSAFAATLLRGGVNLLPQNQVTETLNGLRRDYPGALTIDDAGVADCLTGVPDTHEAEPCPSVPASKCVAVVSTSGSTGQPGRHRKFWGDVVLGAALYRRRFFAGGEQPNTVATVPSQHMYGLETTILPMLQLGYAVDAGRPFMPWAVAEALSRLPAPRLLITTPVHLRACLEAHVAMPEIDMVISATAPLDVETASRAEATWETRVMEIYGSTETGSVASRRTIEGDVWQLYHGMRLTRNNGVWLHGQQLPEPSLSNDDLDILEHGRFRLQGRSGDMLKVAGKRISINAIVQHLQAIKGVQDAAVFRPNDDGEPARPAALVVAPDLSEREIAACLARVVDGVFVPRPLWRVDMLPRNDMGKLPRGELLELFHQTRKNRLSRHEQQ